MAFNVEIRGLRELQAKISSMPKEIHKEVSAVVEAGAKKWVRDAKRDAPVDVGFLKNGISYAQVISSPTKTAFEVVSNAEYSPYMEWGTKTKVSVPADQQSYAAEFRGSGSGDAKKNIYNWMDRVGIPKERQWLVFRSIIVNGVKPQPFFFRHKEGIKQFIEKGVMSITKAIK